jgi:hypothetical protein
MVSRFSLIVYALIAQLCSSMAAFNAPWPHALYVSVIEIGPHQGGDYNMQVKVFSDDLLNALRNDIADQKGMFEDSICLAYTDITTAYFTEHLKLRINDRAVSYQFMDCQQKGGSHWLYFTVTAPDYWTKLEVKADYFIELFPAQSNVLTLHVNGATWTHRFNKKHPSRIFDLNR